MQAIKFTYNWNNKLGCKAFTTIRLHNPGKYRVGENYEIYLKDGNEWKYLGVAECKAIRTFRKSKINEFVAFLDTGYPSNACHKIISRMYKRLPEEDPQMDLILLVYVKKEEKNGNY